MRILLSILLSCSTAFADTPDAPVRPQLTPNHAQLWALHQLKELRYQRDQNGIAMPIVLASIGGVAIASALPSATQTGLERIDPGAAILLSVGTAILFPAVITLAFRAPRRSALGEEIEDLERWLLMQGILPPRR